MISSSPSLLFFKTSPGGMFLSPPLLFWSAIPPTGHEHKSHPDSHSALIVIVTNKCSCMMHWFRYYSFNNWAGPISHDIVSQQSPSSLEDLGLVPRVGRFGCYKNLIGFHW